VQPQWSTGGELFYLHLDGSMMSVRVKTRPDDTAGAAVRLFPTAIVPVPDQPQYGVTADGQRFFGLERVGQTTSFTFLLNWPHAKSADAHSGAVDTRSMPFSLHRGD
jgi:hypothetical protein